MSYFDSFVNETGDLTTTPTQNYKLKNLLTYEIGNLEESANFGIDYAYFVDSSINFSWLFFKNYILNQALLNQIVITELEEEGIVKFTKKFILK
jgi:hypothetical protein